MKLHSLVLSGLCAVAAAVIAQEPNTAPDALIRNVANEVLLILRNDEDIQAGDSKKASELIEAKVRQHFNFVHMARLGLGRDWKTATAAQRKQFTDEFYKLLLRTYSSALTEYRDQEIKFRPFTMKPGESRVKVRTFVAQSGNSPISINYYLEKLPAGWKVYDIEVAGISLVINYRSSFAAEVERGGIEGLIKALREKNGSNTNADAQ